MSTFLSTNVDDFVMLLFLFARGRGHGAARRIIAGQIGSFVCVLLMSWLAALGALALSPRFMAFLGIAPLVLGIVMLYRHRSENHDGSDLPTRHRRHHITVLTAFALTLSIATENVVVYTAYFASLGPIRALFVSMAYLVLLAGLCWLALRTSCWSGLRGFLSRYTAPLAPILYIAVGLVMLVEGVRRSP